MTTSDEYGKLAEGCFRLAREAKTETDRLACLDLGLKWLDAASRQDETIRGRMAEAQELERARKLTPESQQLHPPRWLQRVFGFFR
jgi:hypothetical protein